MGEIPLREICASAAAGRWSRAPAGHGGSQTRSMYTHTHTNGFKCSPVCITYTTPACDLCWFDLRLCLRCRLAGCASVTQILSRAHQTPNSPSIPFLVCLFLIHFLFK